MTDSENILTGIVTVDDVLDVAEAAATREFQMFGGSETLDRERDGWRARAPEDGVSYVP